MGPRMVFRGCRFGVNGAGAGACRLWFRCSAEATVLFRYPGRRFPALPPPSRSSRHATYSTMYLPHMYLTLSVSTGSSMTAGFA